ncbi:36.4 kDa proline-rich protein-like [Andrographis paniculata]|uniref:36.4 kDa proline-rich protein-like n=1 Tax=Andrographis paniculata TaxID=175694 RepID=UPI0021E7F3FF|nr:36.4 kDa proline-rich protein-like [Andrographis paniculata]
MANLTHTLTLILFLNFGSFLTSFACPYCPFPTPPTKPPKLPPKHPPKLKPPTPPVVKPMPPVVTPPIVHPPIIPKPPIIIHPPIIYPPVIPTPPVIVHPPVIIHPPVIPNPPIIIHPPGVTPTPGTPETPCPPPPPPKAPTCPIDALKLEGCVDVLGGLIHIGIGENPKEKCCPLLQGLADLDAAVCLCTTIKAKVLNINILIPIALQVLVDCGKHPPSGFQCPP